MSLELMKHCCPELHEMPAVPNPFVSAPSVQGSTETINSQVDPIIAAALKPVFEKLGGRTKLDTIVGYARAANLPDITYDSLYLDPALCQEFTVAGCCSNPCCAFQHQPGTRINPTHCDEVLNKLAPLLRFLQETQQHLCTISKTKPHASNANVLLQPDTLLAKSAGKSLCSLLQLMPIVVCTHPFGPTLKDW